jgi:hypothetical protein
VVFLAGFQNSLVVLDYQINRDFYEKYCINKDKPKMQCHGKCKMKEEASKNSTQTEIIKISFEFNILPAKNVELPKSADKIIPTEKSKFYSLEKPVSEGFFTIFPHPPTG